MYLCHKNPEDPSCIDIFLTNKNFCFQDSNAFEIGLSNFHKLAVTVMKTCFRKMKPKTIRYRSYKNFDTEVTKASACNFTKIKTPPWVFFTFFKLYK